MPVLPAPSDAPVWADILVDEGGLKVLQRVRLYGVTPVEEPEPAE